MSRSSGDTTVLAGDETVLNKEGYGGKLSSGTAVLAGAGTAEFLIVAVGPLTVAGTCTGVPVTIRYLGEGVGIAGGTITAGQRLQTSASGTWEVATSGESAIGLALEAAASGEQFNLLINGINRAYPEA